MQTLSAVESLKIELHNVLKQMNTYVKDSGVVYEQHKYSTLVQKARRIRESIKYLESL